MRLEDRETRKRGTRFEVARDKVWGRRDVISVHDVHESMGKGVFLHVAASGVLALDIRGSLTLYMPIA